MRKSIIYLTILVMIILGAIAIIYFEGSPSKGDEKLNVSIIAKFGDKNIKTGIEINGNLINTSNDYELIRVYPGLNTIKNVNLENQSFYTDNRVYNITEDTRIDFKLEKPEIPQVEVLGGKPILIKVKSSNFKNVQFCLQGSSNYLFLEAINYTEVEKIQGFELYDSCYKGDFSLLNSEERIYVDYSELLGKLENEFIKITILDKEGNQITKKIK